MVTRASHKAATDRMKQMRQTIPYVINAGYDRRLERIRITLSTGIEVLFDPKDTQGLEDARVSSLSEIEVSPSGYGLHFPKIDADVYVPTLLQGVYGKKALMQEKVRKVRARKQAPKRTRETTAA